MIRRLSRTLNGQVKASKQKSVWLAANQHGWADTLIMRYIDLQWAFPNILIAVYLVAVFGTGLLNVIVAISLAYLDDFARVARGMTLSVKEEQYVAAARTTMVIVAAYISVLVLLYVIAPSPLLELFRPGDISPADFAVIKERGIVVLRFVAAYLLLDGIYMISTAVLKGAGDTKFIMWSMGLISFFGMILPIYIGIEFFGLGLYYAWGCTVFFLCQLAVLTFWRFTQGKWKTMRVIEKNELGSGNAEVGKERS